MYYDASVHNKEGWPRAWSYAPFGLLITNYVQLGYKNEGAVSAARAATAWDRNQPRAADAMDRDRRALNIELSGSRLQQSALK
jgi:hypothetical protein